MCTKKLFIKEITGTEGKREREREREREGEREGLNKTEREKDRV